MESKRMYMFWQFYYKLFFWLINRFIIKFVYWGHLFVHTLHAPWNIAERKLVIIKRF
jgi:hypothetical protein